MILLNDALSLVNRLLGMELSNQCQLRHAGCRHSMNCHLKRKGYILCLSAFARFVLYGRCRRHESGPGCDTQDPPAAYAASRALVNLTAAPGNFHEVLQCLVEGLKVNRDVARMRTAQVCVIVCNGRVAAFLCSPCSTLGVSKLHPGWPYLE